MGLILGSGSGTKPQFPYDMWYGVQHDNTSKDYKLKRVGNLELHKTLPLQNRMKRFVEMRMVQLSTTFILTILA